VGGVESLAAGDYIMKEKGPLYQIIEVEDQMALVQNVMKREPIWANIHAIREEGFVRVEHRGGVE